MAGESAADIDELHPTGGSTGLTSLVKRLASIIPAMQWVPGDRSSSLVKGVGRDAREFFG